MDSYLGDRTARNRRQAKHVTWWNYKTSTLLGTGSKRLQGKSLK